MGLKKNLEAVKSSIIEFAEEANTVKNLNADEYAAHYGGNYTNFLRAVNSKLFLAMSDNYDDSSEEAKNRNQEIVIELKVSKHDGNYMLFDEPKYLGAKETLDTRILKVLLYKAGKSSEFDEKNMVLRIKSVTQLDKLKKTKDEYLEKFGDKLSTVSEAVTSTTAGYRDKAKELYATGKEHTGSAIKKALKNTSDWAEKNL